MKITINTTANAVEKTNYLLGKAIEILKNDEKCRKFYDLTIKDIEAMELFRKKLIDSFLKK